MMTEILSVLTQININYNSLYIPISSALTLVSSLTAVIVAASGPFIKGWNNFKKSKMILAFGEEDEKGLEVEPPFAITSDELSKEISLTLDEEDKKEQKN